MKSYVDVFDNERGWNASDIGIWNTLSLLIIYTQPISHKSSSKVVYHRQIMSTDHLSSHFTLLQLQFLKILKWCKTKRYILTMYNNKWLKMLYQMVNCTVHKAQKPEKGWPCVLPTVPLSSLIEILFPYLRTA